MAGITIVYNGTRPRLVEAVGNAGVILNSGNLHTTILNRKKNFYNTKRTCREIADLVAACNATITLREFTRPAQNGWITTAYVEADDRDVIHYNTEVMGYSVKSQTNTLVHEAIHVIDAFHDRISSFDFTHNGNDSTNPPQNVDSAPYWIGNRAEELVDLLDDHVGQEKEFTALDSVGYELVERYLTEENWTARKKLVCGTH
jgi:hypothetical protein